MKTTREVAEAIVCMLFDVTTDDAEQDEAYLEAVADTESEIAAHVAAHAAENAKLRECLASIIKHQEIACGAMSQVSATTAIAQKCLKELRE